MSAREVLYGQSRRMSLVESILNVLIGFGVGRPVADHRIPVV